MTIRHQQNRKRVRNAIIAGAAVCFCAQAFAADDDYLSMGLEQLMQVPVTGSTLRDESLKTVPAAVTVFTREQLDRFGMDYLYELINLVPGYQMNRGADSGVNYTMSSRGRRNGAQAREIMVVVDGRNFANPRSGSIDSALPLIPLEQIERVEVIRGPGSALYGSSAFNGVINIITRHDINAVRVVIGSDERRSASVSLSQPLGEWKTNLFLRGYEDAGQLFHIPDSFTKEPLTTRDPRRTLNVDLAIGNDATQIRAAYHRTYSSDFYNFENTQNGFNSTVQLFKQISIDQRLDWFDNVKTQLQVGYLATGQELHVAILGAATASQISQPAGHGDFLSKGSLGGNSVNVRLTNDWTIDDGSSALFGVEWRREQETSARAYHNYDLGQLANRQFPINYYGDFTHYTAIGTQDSLKMGGVYGQYLRDLSDKTRLTLGVRHDNYESIGSHTSPRLGVVHQLSDTQTLKLLYGEAYRAPSLGETGVINNPLVTGNPNLSYEVVKTWDLIWMLNLNSARMSVGGFRNDYKDPMVADLVGTTRTTINSSDEFSDGLEIAARFQLTQAWSLRATYTDFFTLPKTAFREAEQLTSFELNFDQGAWNWNLLTYHQSERYALGANNSLHELDGFWVMNSKLRYQFNEGYNLSLQFKNLDDRNFSTPAQGVNLPQGIPNRGREISLMLDWAL
jgi:outer membrane receptor protein involved in Fe transport